MFPLTVAELSKQQSRSGFGEGHQNSAKHSAEGVWLDPSEQLEQLAAQDHASDPSQTAVSTRWGIRENSGAKTRVPKAGNIEQKARQGPA